MALAVTATRHPDKTAILTQRRNVRRPAIPHRRTNTSNKLIDKIAELAFVRHAPLNTSRHQLGDILHLVTQIAFVPLPQSTKRTHPPMHLIGAPLIDNRRTRTLICPSKQTTNHHRTRTRTYRLRNIPRITDATIGDNGNVVLVRLRRAIVNRRNLRNADSRDNTRRAN